MDEYDLVIVGGSVPGRAAATLAARQGARVALVDPPGQTEAAIYQSVLLQGLAEVVQARQPLGLASLGAQNSIHPAPTRDALNWSACRWGIATLAAQAHPSLDPLALATQGIDVVREVPQLSPRPRLAVTTETRRLTGRGVLLAPGMEPTIPAIPGLAAVPYLTTATVMQLDAQPRSLLVLGRSPAAIALAQALALLGTSVTLVARGERLLPKVDPATATTMAALLRAAGVALRLGVDIQAVSAGPNVRLHLRKGDVLTAEHLLVATAGRPAVAGLNLACVGGAAVLSPGPTLMARQRVGVCGPAIAGDWTTPTDWYDAQVAVHNLLYRPSRTYSWLGQVGYVATVPGLGRVGMTATAARRAYGPWAQIIRTPIDPPLAAQLGQGSTCLGQWAVHADGRILGAELIGPQALELIQAVALLRQSDYRLGQGETTIIPGSLMACLGEVSAQWQQRRWQPGRWRRDWAENWFNWRRTAR